MGAAAADITSSSAFASSVLRAPAEGFPQASAGSGKAGGAAEIVCYLLAEFGGALVGGLLASEFDFSIGYPAVGAGVTDARAVVAGNASRDETGTWLYGADHVSCQSSTRRRKAGTSGKLSFFSRTSEGG